MILMMNLLIKFNNYKKLINLLLVRILIIRSTFFFFSNYLFFYMIFELSIIPIIFLIINEGRQIEKIKSLLYLFSYMIFCSLPFLIIILNFDISEYYYIEVNNFIRFLLILIFLIKVPMYIFHN